ncbi:uncharacterized protein MKK02DRAFT_41015 [Dioszegia hungarica]|uniref:Uncharacterized protein n=1 Tax=Dioszegia hungarica TaxID=4972 RepID=A0AA38H2F5_9TREE|nr:uncharacterized protein MKK02DRAFT_41015 [Dioszegia hungarica]KAI9632705.1 hypothetical protein MKK02DRAFT_41015 [Dioszegia hungarica]
MEEAKRSVDEEMRTRLFEISRLIPNGTHRAAQRHYAFAESFISAHEGGRGAVGGGVMVGREREAESLTERLCEYLHLRVLKLKKLSEDGAPVLREGSNEEVYMSKRSLHLLQQYAAKLLEMMAYPPLSPVQAYEGRKLLRSYEGVLCAAMGLRDEGREKMAVYPEEMKVLVEEAMGGTTTAWAWVVEACALYLTFFYTGARPGLLLTSKAYDEYLQWEGVKFIPQRDEDGDFAGFDVVVTLRNWKGRHGNDAQPLIIRYPIRTVMRSEDLLLDLGVFLFSHGSGAVSSARGRSTTSSMPKRVRM